MVAKAFQLTNFSKGMTEFCKLLLLQKSEDNQRKRKRDEEEMFASIVLKSHFSLQDHL